MRNILSAAAAILVLVLTPFAASAQQGKRIAHFTAAASNPFIQAMTKALTERAKALGMEVTTFASPYDPALQAQQIDDAIARKYDLLAINAVSEQAILPVLNRAKQAKIPVLLVNAPPKPGSEDLFISFVGENHEELGKVTGQAALRALKESGRDGGKVALITGSLQEGVGPRRVAGFREALKANPKAQIVAVEDAKWDTAVSEKIAGQLYARFAPQGGLDLVYAMADNQAHGAIRAAEAAKLPLGSKPGQLIVLSSNCLRMGMDNIKAGKQYSTGNQVPGRTGARAAEMIADHFAGKSLPKYAYLPVEAIDRSNLAKWEGMCSF
jgi:ABC-type sugar transport system substrate-binding protein